METENPKARPSTPPQAPAHFANLLYFRGPLAIGGKLAIGEEVVTFTPTGWLDRVVGAAQGLEFLLRDLRAIRITGSIERRLLIETESGSFTFMGSGIEAAFKIGRAHV